MTRLASLLALLAFFGSLSAAAGEPATTPADPAASPAQRALSTARDLAALRWATGSSRQEQDRALAQLEALGAEHEIEQDARGKPFRVVTWNGGDEGLAQLRVLDDLRWLDCSRTKVTD